MKDDYFEKNFWKKSHSNVVTPIYEVSNDYQRFDIKIQYKIGLMIILKMFLIEKWFLQFIENEDLRKINASYCKQQRKSRNKKMS